MNTFFFYDQISQRVFEIMRTELLGKNCVASSSETSGLVGSKVYPHIEDSLLNYPDLDKINGVAHIVLETQPFESYKRRTTAVVNRETFLNVVCDALAEYKYVGPNQRADLVMACRYVFHFFFLELVTDCLNGNYISKDLYE